jgi:hypothetical protein
MIRRNSNLDYSSDILSNIVIPLMPICQHGDLEPAAQRELLNLENVRSDVLETFLWDDISFR